MTYQQQEALVYLVSVLANEALMRIKSDLAHDDHTPLKVKWLNEQARIISELLDVIHPALPLEAKRDTLR